MTLLRVLGSGSSGNCIALEDDGAVLLLDAGFSAKDMKRPGVQGSRKRCLPICCDTAGRRTFWNVARI